MDNSVDFIVGFDRQLRYLFIYPVATGIPLINYIGKTNEELGMPLALCDDWNYHLGEVFETGQPKEIEFEFETVDGLRLFQSLIVPVRQKSGCIETLVAIAYDITERQPAEVVLQQANEELENSVAQRTTQFTQINNHLSADGCWAWLKSIGTDWLADLNIRERVANTDNISNISEVSSDFGLRKQAEEALRQSEERLQLVIDAANDAIWDWDINNNTIFWSERAYQFFGLSPDTTVLSHETIAQRIHPEQQEQFFQALQNHLAFNHPFQVELRIQQADGSYSWFRHQGKAVRDTNGQPIRMVGSITDINSRKLAEEALRQAHDELEIRVQERTAELTRINESLQAEISERKLAEEALQVSEHFIQQIADTTPTLLYIYDLIQNCNVYANRQTETFFGSTQAEIQAMGSQFFAEVLHPDDFQHLASSVARLATAQEGEVIEKEYRMKNAKSEWRWLYSREVVFTRNSEGIAEQILGTAIDITEVKQAEEIRIALEKEKELSQLQHRFFSMVSHEFRTPISSILVSAQSLEQSYERWSKGKIIKNIHRIQGCAKHTIHLLEDILTITRAENGTIQVNKRLINLEIFCANLLEDMELIFGNMCKITFVSQGNCQKTYLDEKLLRSILENLVTNALKYSLPGSNVYFRLGCNQEEAIFQICDEGIGIPSEDIPHLFEPFHRGKNVENIPGTGLGITLVKKCLDIQGGKIFLDSELGVGTTVTVTIPYR